MLVQDLWNSRPKSKLIFLVCADTGFEFSNTMALTTCSVDFVEVTTDSCGLPASHLQNESWFDLICKSILSTHLEQLIHYYANSSYLCNIYTFAILEIIYFQVLFGISPIYIGLEVSRYGRWNRLLWVQFLIFVKNIPFHLIYPWDHSLIT